MLGAFDHLGPTNQMITANHTAPLRRQQPATSVRRFNQLWKRYKICNRDSHFLYYNEETGPTKTRRHKEEESVKLARTLVLVVITGVALMGTGVIAQKSPKFEIDASWPKSLPNNWIFGQIGGIFVDKDDNVWISQRPRTVNDRDKRAELGDKSICCYTAPSVVEFNQAGDVVKAWGGPRTAQGYDWPQNEHGMFIDYRGNVWLGGNGENDGMVLKFANDGKFLLSIGKSAKQTNSLDQMRVSQMSSLPLGSTAML
jgi:hypothetical protein